MVDVTINDLTLATSVLSTDELEIQKTGGGVSEKVTVAQINQASITGGFKNKIINGDFNIWQRGVGFVAIANGSYNADRFKYSSTSTAVHTLSQSTDTPTQAESGLKSNYSLLYDCTTADSDVAAGDVVSVRHIIEGYNYKLFEGNTGTLSFWVKGTKTGAHCISFRNNSADLSYIAEYTVNVADTWEKKVITLDFDYSGGGWDYTTGRGLIVEWILTSGSAYHTTANTWQSGNYRSTANQVNACDSIANDFRVAQIQFELGDVATNFESLSIQQELALCQRYYWKDDVAVNSMGMFLQSTTDTTRVANVFFPVEMRVPPAFSGATNLGALSNFDVRTTHAMAGSTDALDTTTVVNIDSVIADAEL